MNNWFEPPNNWPEKPANNNTGSGPRIFFDSLILGKKYFIKRVDIYAGEIEYSYYFVKLEEKTDDSAKFLIYYIKSDAGTWNDNEVLEPNGSDAYGEFSMEEINNTNYNENGFTAEIYDAEAVENLPQQPSPNSSIYGTDSNNYNNTGNQFNGGRRKTKRNRSKNKKRKQSRSKKTRK